MTDVIAVLAAALLAGAWAAHYFGEPARTRRRMKGLAYSDIGTASEGPVKISGTLKLLGGPLRAPLSGRPCALYDVVVTEHGKGKSLFIHDRVAIDFLLDDGTGTALVRVGPGDVKERLDLAIVQDARYESGIFENPTPTLERFLAKHGEQSAGVLFNRPLTYDEGIFEPGERIVVCGVARRELDPDPSAAGGSYRERPTRLVIEPLDGKLHVSDEPGLAAADSRRERASSRSG